MRPAIYATGVTVEIDGARLLDDVDLTVGAGDWVNVIGPNGAGKSTLLRALGGARRRVAGGSSCSAGRWTTSTAGHAAGSWPTCPSGRSCHRR